MTPRIGFAIPFHRGLDFLREALASVRAQQNEAWTCLVVDDRGEAEGAAAATVDALGDPRIRVVTNPANLGMVGCWNRCLDLADTELVTLLHADDRLLPGYTDCMLELADRYPAAVALACGAEIIGPDGAPRFSFADTVKQFLVPPGEPWRLHAEAGLRALLRGDFVMCPTLAWRRSQLGSSRFEPGWRQVQDLELLARLLLEGEELVGTRRHAYAYRRHAESATARQTDDLSRFEEEVALLDRIAGQAEARGWSRAARTARHKAIVRLHLAYRAAADLASGRPGAALRTLRYLATLRAEAAAGNRRP